MGWVGGRFQRARSTGRTLIYTANVGGGTAHLEIEWAKLGSWFIKMVAKAKSSPRKMSKVGPFTVRWYLTR